MIIKDIENQIEKIWKNHNNKINEFIKNLDILNNSKNLISKKDKDIVKNLYQNLIYHSINFDEEIGELFNVIDNNQSNKKTEQEVISIVETKNDNQLSVIKDVIEKASYIKELEDDWDGEGAKGYSDDIWNRVTNFITETYKKFWDVSGSCVSTPEISPVLDGSIDVHWRLPKRQILVNFPVGKEYSASFFGYDNNNSNEMIQGKLNLSLDNSWILEWLIK